MPGESGLFADLYKSSTKNPYSYLLIDVHPRTTHDIVLRQDILPDEIETKGQRLFKDLSLLPDISWNDNGLVTLKGFQIPGSDIVDLIAGALDQSYSNRNSSSPGKDAFEKWINKLKGSRYKMTKPLPITPTTPPGATQVAPTQSPTQSPITQLQTP
ncbi:unnamed protein product [Rotaria socialis]|uniref:Uncharacterized protein n=1 Tax=Rotaria socialis TaxID=392032 RepID=A0A821P1B8_9BILA|nr:unnamed protein product [Rotaria socialis]